MDDRTGALEAADGTILFTREWEAEEPKANMLLVHGLGEHCGRWDHVGRFFAEGGYTVYSFDLRGHGRSGGPRTDVESFDDFLSDVSVVARYDVMPAGLPWVLYGHSMGGLIAARYLTTAEPQPAAAILSAPALSADVPVVLRWTAKGLGSVWPGLRFPSSITGEQLSRDPTVGEAYFADPLVETKVTARFGKELFAAQEDTVARLDQIDVPTLVIHGGRDELVPATASEPLESLDCVEREVYPDLCHEMHNEPEQDQVLEDVSGWLDSVLDRSAAK